MKKFLFILTIIFTLISFTACTNGEIDDPILEPKIVNLDIDYNQNLFNNMQQVVIQNYPDIYNLKFKVIYDDGNIIEKKIASEFLSTSDIDKLSSNGTYQITINYEGKTLIIDVVVFNDQDTTKEFELIDGILSWPYDNSATKSFSIYINNEIIIQNYKDQEINIHNVFSNIDDGNLYLIELKYSGSSTAIDYLFYQNTSESINRVVAPTDVMINKGLLTWTWIDPYTISKGFNIFVDGKIESTQYAPRFDLNRYTESLYQSKKYNIVIVSIGDGSNKSDSIYREIEYNYEVLNFDVKFHFNDGAGQVITKRTTQGKVESGIPERENFIFNGWYTSNDGGQTLVKRWNDSAKVTENMDLYADWIIKEASGGIKLQTAPAVSIIGDTLSWNAIQGATLGYDLEILDSNRVRLEYINSYNSTEYNYYYNIYDHNLGQDRTQIIIRVRTKGDGLTSVNSPWVERTINITQVLPRITSYIYDPNIGVVYWNDIDYSYQVELRNKSGIVLSENISKPEFVISNNIDADNYTLVIKTGTGVTSTFELRKIRLVTPSNVSAKFISDMMEISWDAVKNANQYIIEVNGESYISNVNSLLISAEHPSYVISVTAKDANNDFIISFPSTKEFNIEKDLENEILMITSGNDNSILESLFVGLDAYTIPTQITEIKSYALENLTNLLEIIIIHEINIINKNAFYNLPNATIKIYGFASAPKDWDNEWYGDVDYNFNPSKIDGFYLYQEVGEEVIITKYLGNEEVVVIPAKINDLEVVRITTNAFENNSFIKEIIVKSNITNIEFNAFSNINNLKKINLPFVGESNNSNNKHLGYIFGAENFYNQHNFLPEAMNTVILENLTIIGENAFYGCNNVLSVFVPISVETIEQYAFYQADSLTIYAEATSRPVGWIEYYHGKVIFDVSSLNIYSDLIYDIKDNEARILKYNGNETILNIPEYIEHLPVTKIGNNSFYESKITSIVLPDSIKSIGDYAFYNASLLTSIFIPKNVEEIGNLAFVSSNSISIYVEASSQPFGWKSSWNLNQPIIWDTKSVDSNLEYTYVITNSNTITIVKYIGNETNINIPSTIDGLVVKEIGSYSFYQSNITNVTIPSSIVSIGDRAFSNARSLTSVVIPISVLTIGKYAFNGSSITIYSQTKTKPIGWDVFWTNDTIPVFWDSKLIEANDNFKYVITFSNTIIIVKYLGSETNVTIPSIIDDLPVTEIGSHAFYQSNILSCDIPDSVTEIGAFSFASLINLTNITIPYSVTKIGASAFRNSTNLDSITLPFIGESFESEKNFFGYIFGASIYNDQESYIPSSLTTVILTNQLIINYGAFYKVSLISLVIPNTCTSFEPFSFYESRVNEIIFEENSSLESIGNNAFRNSTITTISLPTSVTTIGDNAFSYAKSLTTISLSNSITSIGKYAFQSTPLISVLIPENVNTIGERAFDSNLRIYVKHQAKPEGWNYWWNYNSTNVIWDTKEVSSNPDYRYVITNSNNVIIDKYIGEMLNITIPLYIEELPVKNIGSYAFAYTGVNNVYFENNCEIENIGSRAFYSTHALTSIIIPNSVTALGAYAFAESRIAEIIFEENSKITVISENLFYNATLLKDIVIPNSVTTIENNAFARTNSLLNISIPRSVTKIESYAFSYTSLETIIIPINVTNIIYSAIFEANALTIYAEASSKPDGWNNSWNPYNRPVVWSYTLSY